MNKTKLSWLFEPFSSFKLKSGLWGLLLVTLLACLPHQVYSQVVIQPKPIAGFQFSSKDILNFTVVSTTNTAVRARFVARLTDAQGRVVVTYQSAVHTIKPGAVSYDPISFKIATIAYSNRQIQAIEQTSKYMPTGDYTYCITIECADNRNLCKEVIDPENTFEACMDVRAEPITPLLLSFPEDEAELLDKRPNFSWIPPMPLGSNPNIRYTIRLTKMRDNQSAEDAIRRNRPIYERDQINGLTQMFPNQLDDLEEFTHYAWQVSAHIGEQHIATSEVWEFEIKGPIRSPFVNLNHPGNGLHRCVDALRFTYQNEYGPRALNYQILDAQGQDITPKGFEIPLENGRNKFEFTPDELGLDFGVTYQLIATEPKGKKYTLRFVCTKGK